MDGHRAATQMVTPALVAVAVPPGTHHITFRYTGYASYPLLIALALLAILAAATTTLLRPARQFPAKNPARQLPKRTIFRWRTILRRIRGHASMIMGTAPPSRMISGAIMRLGWHDQVHDRREDQRDHRACRQRR